jgi:hypothetical protein
LRGRTFGAKLDKRHCLIKLSLCRIIKIIFVQNIFSTECHSAQGDAEAVSNPWIGMGDKLDNNYCLFYQHLHMILKKYFAQNIVIVPKLTLQLVFIYHLQT